MTARHRAVRKFSIDNEAIIWTGSDDDDVEFGDVVDESQGSRMGVSFIRWEPGQAYDFDFPLPYDEVFVVLRGTYSVTSDDGTVTAGEGEVIFLPAGTEGRYHSDQGAELVALTTPPYREALRNAGHGHLLDDRPIED